MGVLLEGGAGEAEIAAFLIALKMKGETAAEIAGFARAMRDRMIVVDAGPMSSTRAEPVATAREHSISRLLLPS